MNTQHNIPWEKLAQYFAGELTGEEYRNMETWIKADPVREEKIEQLYEIWKESGALPYRLNTDESWGRLVSSMDRMDAEAEISGRKTGSGRMFTLSSAEKNQRTGKVVRRVALAAATVLVVLTAGLLALQYQSGMVEDQTRVIMTKDGERASYTLADGSRVVLHAGSRLEIPENYNAKNRELFLEGEAYFETAHNPDKPFIVHSEHTFTQVVGTRFLVQAWAGSNEKVEVVVSEGKVMFGNRKRSETADEQKKVLLSENQRGVIAGGADPVVDDIPDLNWYMGWTKGRLVFENRPLDEVLPRLERWYDIEIRVADEAIASQEITAEIDYSLPMSDVLEGIALTLNLEVELLGDRKFQFNKRKL